MGVEDDAQRLGSSDVETIIAYRQSRVVCEHGPDTSNSLGQSYLNTFLYGWTHAPIEAFKRAEKLTLEALSIDPSSVDGHRLLGQVYLHRRQHDLALIELERAIAINPNDAQSHAVQGMLLVWGGHPDGAINALETALRFDPGMNSESLAHLGLAYYLKKRYEDAIKVLERSSKQNADYLFAHQLLAASYGQWGRSEAAARETAAVRRLDPFFDVDSFGSLARDPADAAKLVDGLRKAGLE